ncbi:hypothetical protein D3C76_763840 [compost metagenome]
MAKAQLWINDVEIKHPGLQNFGLESYNLTKSGRVASGKMVIELIAKKRKFTFRYEVLSDIELRKIKNLIDGTAMFFTLKYTEDNVIKSAVVYAGALKWTPIRTGNVWYYKDVAFDLIEQ